MIRLPSVRLPLLPSLLLGAVAIASPAAAQDCIYVPDNDPDSGPVSTIPFGGSDVNDLQNANQRLLVRIPNALFPRRPVRIREIGFAPAGSGTRVLRDVGIGVGTLPAGTPLSPVFHHNHPGFGAGVQGAEYWDWRVTAGQWNHLGWRESFPFDPADNRDLIVEISVAGAALPGSQMPGFHSDPSLDHVLASGYPGGPPSSGVVGQGAPKMKICFDVAVSGVYGRGCAGTNGVPTLDFTGSPQLGSSFGIGIGNGPANSTAVLVADPRIANAHGLDPFGMPGCRQYTHLPGIVSVAIPLSAQGGANLNVTIPGTPNAVGALLYMQAYVLDPPANGLGFVNTPVGYVQIGS